MNMLRTTTLCLCLAMPLAAQAGASDHGSASSIGQELSDARKEVRADLAETRKELETGNLRLGEHFHFEHDGDTETSDLPPAEITPDGDLLIDGKAQDIDAGQRRQLLAYRERVVAIALDGVEAGQVAADAALDAVGDSWIGIFFNAITGRLGNRVERVVQQQVEPMVLGICKQLPAVMQAQHELAASVPAFKPYADLEQRDIEECEGELRHEFASR